MTKTAFIAALTRRCHDCSPATVDDAVHILLDHFSEALSHGERIEIRGFGSFSPRFRPPRLARHPTTGESIALTGKYAPHFKPGKALRERVNARTPRT